MKPNIPQRKLRLAILSALTLGAITPGAFAAIDTGNLTVSAEVAAACTIDTAPVLFGAYDPLSEVDTTQEGSVSVECTNGAAAAITLGQGTAPIGDVAAAPVRQMSGGAAAAGRLGYFLYSDEALSTVWGNDATSDVEIVGDGLAAQELIVYGQILASQNVIVGSYSDTVVATVTF